MKTMLERTFLAGAVILGLAGAAPAMGEDSMAAAPHPEKRFDGTVTSVDPKERTIAVRGWLMTRTFNAATDCRVALEDQPESSLADLRPGQRVDLHYIAVHGVRVARQIEQRNREFEGRVTALDPVQKTVTVKRGLRTRGFVLAEGAPLILRGEQSESLEGLKLGDVVKVTYQTPIEPLIAQRIEQQLPTFSGNIQAIDSRARTVTVRHLRTEKKFHLAKDCPIVSDGKLNGRLSDLRIGERTSVTYEDAQGVLVANRIGRESEAADGAGSQTAALGSSGP